MSGNKRLFCFGMGFVGQTLGHLARSAGWHVSGTARREKDCRLLGGQGFETFLFDGKGAGEGVADALNRADFVLNAIPPGEGGDPVLEYHGSDLARAAPRWFGLLSTVGVYGEHHGGWVDEETPPDPLSRRSKLRWQTERQWKTRGRETGLPPHIFRLPGIYGPGRNQLETVMRGRARRLVKPGQVFNRVHVDDIALTLLASMQRPQAGNLFNVTDDEPAPPQDVVSFACKLLEVAPPPEIPFEKADLSPMARSFYGECKRVRNRRIKARLGIVLKYPTYRQGLKALYYTNHYTNRP